MLAILLLFVEICLGIILFFSAGINFVGAKVTKSIISYQVSNALPDSYFNHSSVHCNLLKFNDATLSKGSQPNYILSEKKDLVNFLTSFVFNANQYGRESAQIFSKDYGPISVELNLQPRSKWWNDYVLRTVSNIGRSDPFLSVPDFGIMSVKFTKPLTLGPSLEVSELVLKLDLRQHGFLSWIGDLRRGNFTNLEGVVFFKNYGYSKMNLSYYHTGSLDLSFQLSKNMPLLKDFKELDNLQIDHVNINYQAGKNVIFTLKMIDTKNLQPNAIYGDYQFKTGNLDLEIENPIMVEDVSLLDLDITNIGYNKISKVKLIYQNSDQPQTKEIWGVFGDGRSSSSDPHDYQLKFSTSPKDLEVFKSLDVLVESGGGGC